MEEKKRMVIVEDHTILRQGLRSLLSASKNLEVVGEAADGLDGVKRAKTLRPDVVLLDLHMPGTPGKDALKLLLEEVPETKVLMLTVSEDAEDLIETLRSGATGYLLKNIDTEMLLDSVRRAAEGEAMVSPQMTGKLVQGLKAPAKAEPAMSEKDKLSPREREILAFLAKGASNKEIARNLDLAESTVKIHVQHILRKLNLSSRVQAAVYAVEAGLTETR